MTNLSSSALVVTREHGFAIVQIECPDVLNALNHALMREIKSIITELDADPDVRCIILTGSNSVFAAGADVKEMAIASYAEMYREDRITANWEAVANCRTPTIAAVAGYALGGGCELAMMCDIIIAAEDAQFGQPELNLGISPGAGGTQRLPRAVGKAKTMDMILTTRVIGAVEAERIGLVSRVVPNDELISEAVRAAKKISSLPPLAVMLTKEMVNTAFETPLTQGIILERRYFYSLFAYDDQKEGMAAFIEKRRPNFKGQ
jgi:enoyl-CoA hydratase/carnithine racemase